jgi:hypothetical protein
MGLHESAAWPAPGAVLRIKKRGSVMKLESLTSRARYLALVLPGFALFSAVHGGCIRGPAGYGAYGVYGYGNRASALEEGAAPPDEGECVVHGGEGESGSEQGADCDEGDTSDGYQRRKGHGGRDSP